MFGGDEWLIIAIVALVLFGGSQLPKLAKNLGEAQRELKKAMKEPEEPAPSTTASTAASAPASPPPSTTTGDAAAPAPSKELTPPPE